MTVKPEDQLKSKAHFYLSAITRAAEEVELQMTLIKKYQDLLLEDIEAEARRRGVTMAPPATTAAQDSINDSRSPHNGDGFTI